jgi:hypothetical protein
LPSRSRSLKRQLSWHNNTDHSSPNPRSATAGNNAGGGRRGDITTSSSRPSSIGSCRSSRSTSRPNSITGAFSTSADSSSPSRSPGQQRDQNGNRRRLQSASATSSTPWVTRCVCFFVHGYGMVIEPL